MLINDKAFVVVSASQIDRTLSAFGHEEKIAKKILIIGGGNIGFNLAKNLEKSLEDARIKIVEKNKERAEQIASELENSIVINGDGLDEEVLKEANIEEIETVLALTNDDEDNVMACVLAEKFSSGKRTIALVNKSNYSLLDGEYEFIEAEIIETSELINKSLKESNLPKEIRIGAILRKDDIIIPKSNFVFEKKDLVVFLSKRDQLSKVENLFRISSF